MRTEYGELLGQVRRISAELLPPISPTANYSDGQILRMYAFRLSAHAEVEGFLELCANDLISHYSARLNGAGLSPALQRTVLLHDHMRESFPPKSLSILQAKKSPSERVKACLNTQSSIVSSNNGVSEKDVLKLFIPLGFEYTFFEIRWLASMSALASARGDAAHNSWLDGTIVQPTPQDERTLLVQPLLGMRRLVDEVVRLKSIA